MKGYVQDILSKAISNNYFRQVIETGDETQTVVMCIKPGEDIGNEVHPNNEQVLICVEGSGKAILNKEEGAFRKGDLVVVKAGTEHNFLNSGSNEMKIITIYSPPHHSEGTIHKTKAEALEAEANE